MELLYLWTGGGLAWTGGSTAQVGVAGVGGSFGAVWAGSTVQIGVAGVSDLFRANQIWGGSLAVVGIGGQSGLFSGVGRALGTTGIMTVGRSRTETQVRVTRTAMMVGTGRARTGAP